MAGIPSTPAWDHIVLSTRVWMLSTLEQAHSATLLGGPMVEPKELEFKGYPFGASTTYGPSQGNRFVLIRNPFCQLSKGSGNRMDLLGPIFAILG